LELDEQRTTIREPGVLVAKGEVLELAHAGPDVATLAESTERLADCDAAARERDAIRLRERERPRHGEAADRFAVGHQRRCERTGLLDHLVAIGRSPRDRQQ